VAKPKKFDPTLKDLARDYPTDFLTTFDGPPTVPVALLNVDLSTITLAADLVLGLGDPLGEIVTIDFQASANATKDLDLLAYNTLLHRAYRVPVHSILLYLRPKAAHSNQDGTITYQGRPGRGKMDFGYEILRLWQRPAQELLAGALGTLPLALLCELPAGVSVEAGMTTVIDQMVRRILAEAPEDRAQRLLTSAFLLAGLRVEREVARQLFQGVQAMRESDTYVAILDEGRDQGRNEGRLDEAREGILRLGQLRFGAPSEAITATLNGIAELERLRRIHDQLMAPGLATWTDLLNTP
jgi:predicted transposase YdaD